eukprot:356165-Chlamydomonas_euryale.AAC.1
MCRSKLVLGGARMPRRAHGGLPAPHSRTATQQWQWFLLYNPHSNRPIQRNDVQRTDIDYTLSAPTPSSLSSVAASSAHAPRFGRAARTDRRAGGASLPSEDSRRRLHCRLDRRAPAATAPPPLDAPPPPSLLLLLLPRRRRAPFCAARRGRGAAVSLSLPASDPSVYSCPKRRAAPCARRADRDGRPAPPP